MTESLYGDPEMLKRKLGHVLELGYFALERLGKDPTAERETLGRLTREAINDGRLRGRLALAAYAHYGSRTDPALGGSPPRYHGTPFDARLSGGLEPRQALWLDASRKRYYAHGKPAVSASSDYNFPITRALLHPASPALSGIDALVLNDRPDMHGRRYWLTSEKAIQLITEAKAGGHVVSLSYPIGDFQRCREWDEPYYDPVFRKKLDEYRFHGNCYAALTIPVTAEDLPPDLLVVDAPTAEDGWVVLSELPNQESPIALSDALGVSIRPLGGVWPLGLHPRATASWDQGKH